MNPELPTSNREADIWARLMRGRPDELPAEAATFLLSVDFQESDKRRMLDLADRSEEGNLSEEEKAELDSYLHVGNFLAILQSKARIALRKQGLHGSQNG